jgi:cytochrome c-type biogenesis protein CcmH
LLFWIVACALVLIAMLAAWWPALRPEAPDTNFSAAARALAAELEEVDADEGRRYPEPADAEAARAEIGRRMLALERSRASAAKTARSSPMALGIAALAPIVAVPLYLVLGQPEYGDQPVATRADRAQLEAAAEVEALIARVEERLARVPDDARGWALIAPVYYRQGRIDDALGAYDKALQHFAGVEADRLRLTAERAEVTVARDDGQVSDAAAEAFAAHLAIAPDDARANYYLAAHAEQAAATPEARKAPWVTLIARFEAANPAWLQAARNRLAALDGAAPAAGPSQADVEAAAAMTAGERAEMIRSMVDGLAARLKDQPDDAEGWLRLIRARMVLEDRAQAGRDLATARAQFATPGAERSAIDALAAEFGL